MTVSLALELKMLFRHMEPYVMIDAIKEHFKDEMKLEQFRQLRKFQTIHMEEHTCLETHLKRLYGIYFKLTNVYDFWMADSGAIETALISLPPSYEEHVRQYAIKRDTMSFFTFVNKFKSLKVESIEGELFDASGIIDIRSYKCILLILDEKYLILVMFMKQSLIITSMRRG